MIHRHGEAHKPLTPNLTTKKLMTNCDKMLAQRDVKLSSQMVARSKAKVITGT